MSKLIYTNSNNDVISVKNTELTFRGVWSGLRNYQVRDVASFDGRLFVVLLPHAGVPPPRTTCVPSPTYWSPLLDIDKNAA